MQVLQNLYEAKNMALKVEFMLQERGRYDSSRRNYGGEIPGHLLTREWRFTSHRHIMTNTKMTRQLENRKKQILRRPQRPLTLMPSQHQESFSSTTNLVTDPATIPLEGQYTWLREIRDEEGDDDGHNYAVRKLILALKQKERTQHHQLFRTRCTSNNRLFKSITNNGSCKNIISREAVRVLQIPVEKHPNPYSIRWIKATENIEVREHDMVLFSTGKYRDEVYYNVVYMDACQLLFGRPWQFDLDAQHAGRENVYRLERDKVKFTLLLLRSGSYPKISRMEGRTFFSIKHSE